MKKYTWLLAILLFVVSCRAYQGKSNPLSPDEVQVSDMATALVNDSAALQQSTPAALKDTFDSFIDATQKFQNLCLRMGANSLEAHKAFDQIMFVEAQISQSKELQSNPDFDAKWQQVRKDRVMGIAKKLGYRPEKQ